ncbi:hypothetical protein IL306_002808 [Fusarium sp. DS 682]|nr:hypothetical protein IL306_002808 [Fusarium sp. DS 682]
MALHTIPVEIRQTIFEHVITAPVVPPANPSESQHGRFRREESDESSGIWRLPPKNKALSLLLVCKKFYAEAQDVLSRLPSNSYHVDIMFVKSYGLWTTWDVPKLPTSRYIDKVTATMRIFEPTDDLNDRFKGSLDFRGGCGGPELAVWAFYGLLMDLFREGPGYVGSRHIGNRSYIINKIDVNVVAPTDGADHNRLDCSTNDSKSWLRRSRFHCGEDENELPEVKVAGYMTSNLQYLFGASRYAIEYCLTLHEHIIDGITFRVNGEERKRFEMDRLLKACDVAKWSYDHTFIDRNAAKVTRWMNWVVERREKMKKGLELDYDRPETCMY